MKKVLVKVVIGIAVLGIVAIVAVFLSLNGIIKKGVETVGPQVTGVEVKLDGVALSPLNGGGKLSGLVVGNTKDFKSSHAIKAGTISANVNTRSVFSDKIIVESVEVLAPDIIMEGSLSGNNLTAILANVEKFTASMPGGGDAKDAPKDAKGASKKLQVNRFVLKDAKVTVALTMLGGKGATVPLPDIVLSDLGTGPDGITAADLIKRVTEEIVGASIKAAGKAVGELGKGVTEAGKDAGKAAGEAADKATSGIKKLFKK